MIGYTPANELIQAAKSVSNQVGVPMIVLGVIERDSHDGASRHLGNYTACCQMISKSALGDHNMQGRLRNHPHWAGYAQKKDRKQSFQSHRLVKSHSGSVRGSFVCGPLQDTYRTVTEVTVPIPQSPDK